MPTPALTAATIFDYCERGLSSAFWAEPLNAITNGGFLLAAFAGAAMIARRPPGERSAWAVFFVLNFIAIGIGSFLFHTVPNVDTAAADTGPIGVFMVAYLVFALRRLAGAPWRVAAAALAAFFLAMTLAFKMQCWEGRIGFWLDMPPGAQGKCLNGSLGYGPALIAMWLIAGWLAVKRHEAALFVFAAAAAFLASLTFRSLDQRLCADWVVLGHRTGTHFIWHVLNSLTLFLLLVAAIRHGCRTQEILPPRPKAAPPTYSVP
ncbi:MAG: ceramidase domain-containing protein [Rhodomicrobium sp.]